MAALTWPLILRRSAHWLTFYPLTFKRLLRLICAVSTLLLFEMPLQLEAESYVSLGTEMPHSSVISPLEEEAQSCHIPSPSAPAATFVKGTAANCRGGLQGWEDSASCWTQRMQPRENDGNQTLFFPSLLPPPHPDDVQDGMKRKAEGFC